MKKFLITISIVAALVLNANAQGDGFFTYNSMDDNRTESGQLGLWNPAGEAVFSGQDQPAPIGSGWLLLAGMGAGYALLRRREK